MPPGNYKAPLRFAIKYGEEEMIIKPMMCIDMTPRKFYPEPPNLIPPQRFYPEH